MVRRQAYISRSDNAECMQQNPKDSEAVPAVTL